MAFVGFYDNGYDYLNDLRFVLFSSDNTHNDLFDYINKDLHQLPDLFERYITNRIDTTTFDLKDYQNNDDLNELIENIKTIHPYFKYDYENDLKNKIGGYFNQLLIYTINKENAALYEYAVQKEWYIERLKKLLLPVSFVDDIYCDIFFHNFLISVGDREDDVESFSSNVPGQKPLGFGDEIKTQNAVCNLLYFILDISAPDINELELSQRIWLYRNMFTENNLTVDVTQNLLFFSPKQYRDKQEHSKETVNELNKNIRELKWLYALPDLYEIFERNGNHKFPKPPDLKNLNIERDGIPHIMKDIYKFFIKYAETVKETKLYEEYNVKSLRELLYLEILSMIRSNTMIRKCNNCGKYFVVKDKRKFFCDRVYEKGKHCNEIGSSKRLKRLRQKDEAYDMHFRFRKANYDRYDYGKIGKEDYDEMLKTAQELLKKVRAEELDISDYQNLLKKIEESF